MNTVPSHKLDIECYMICSLIVNPDLYGKLAIKEDHFYHHNNLLAFKCLKEMHRTSEAVNLITFGGRLFDAGGKISEFSSLLGSKECFSELFVDAYLKQLAEETAKRKILKEYQNLKNAPKEFIEEMKKIELEFIENKPKTLEQSFDDYVENYNLKKAKLNSKGSVGLVTGFSKIDSNCTFDEGNLIILAANTSVGKSALALNIAVNSAMFGQNCLFFSAEMSINELLERMFAQLTGVSSTKFKYCNADSSLQLAKNEIQSCKDSLKFINAASLTSDDICRIVRQESSIKKPDLIVVDYIQYLKDKIEKGNTNNDRIGNITRNLKGLAMDLRCSVLALSQVNRNTKGVPELSNLRDSGNIEQDADIVLILHREEKEDVIADLVIAKNRNGQVMKTNLKFNPSLTKFYE